MLLPYQKKCCYLFKENISEIHHRHCYYFSYIFNTSFVPNTSKCNNTYIALVLRRTFFWLHITNVTESKSSCLDTAIYFFSYILNTSFVPKTSKCNTYVALVLRRTFFWLHITDVTKSKSSCNQIWHKAMMWSHMTRTKQQISCHVLHPLFMGILI